MRTFSCKSPEDASQLPWTWEVGSENRPIWGVNIVPVAQYASWSGDVFNYFPVGEPISYTWSALLDPPNTPLPAWITETTPQIAESDLQDVVNSTN